LAKELSRTISGSAESRKAEPNTVVSVRTFRSLSRPTTDCACDPV